MFYVFGCVSAVTRKCCDCDSVWCESQTELNFSQMTLRLFHISGKTGSPQMDVLSYSKQISNYFSPIGVQSFLCVKGSWHVSLPLGGFWCQRLTKFSPKPLRSKPNPSVLSFSVFLSVFPVLKPPLWQHSCRGRSLQACSNFLLLSYRNPACGFSQFKRADAD